MSGYAPEAKVGAPSFKRPIRVNVGYPPHLDFRQLIDEVQPCPRPRNGL